MSKKGLDISTFQNGIDFQEIKNQGYEFIMLRGAYTGYGTGVDSYKDANFEEFYNKAKAVGLCVGCYMYSCANTREKGRAEAKFLYENCLKGKQFEYPISIDVEDEHHQLQSKEGTTDAIIGFCEYLEDKGYYVSVYANTNWFTNIIDTPRLQDYDKWIAQWSVVEPNVDFDYGMWQNSSSGNIAGITVDTDIAFYDFENVIKTKGLNGFLQTEEQNIEYKKSNEEIAQEVKDGLWCDGAERYERLVNAGYDYDKIQEIVTNSKKSNNYTEYTVQWGDNLTKIANKFNTTISKIVQDNNIVDSDKIYAGQVLKIYN